MRLSYYAVYQQNIKTNTKNRINLKKIVDDIINNQKKSSKKLSEFISHVIGDIYLFVKINDSEILKKVNTTTLDVDDLNKLLNNDEKLGFTSYFVIKDCVVGYGCTYFSAKHNKFNEYLNEKYFPNNDDEIILEPLVKNVTIQDALKLSFIGRTTMRMENNNGFFNTLKKELGLSGINDSLIDGIDITIRPIRGENIKSPISRLINKHANHAEKLKFIAREHLADQAQELYLADNILCSIINAKKSIEIPNLIEKLYSQSKNDIIKKQTDLFNSLKI